MPFPSGIDSLQLPRPKAGPPGRGHLIATTLLDHFVRTYPLPITGFLGSGWWAHRVWRIDYPAGKLWLFPRSVLPANGSVPGSHELRLYFRTVPGRRSMNFPRFRAAVDGDSLDLLFDTGASVQFTDSALAVVNDGRPARRARQLHLIRNP